MSVVHNKWWQRFVEVTAIERVLLTVGHCYLVFVLCVFSELFWRQRISAVQSGIQDYPEELRGETI